MPHSWGVKQRKFWLSIVVRRAQCPSWCVEGLNVETLTRIFSIDEAVVLRCRRLAMLSLRRAADNPFATEHLHRLSFRFVGCTMWDLMQRCDACGGRGIIVGPQGSGKTTLLTQLHTFLRDQGWQVICCRYSPITFSQRIVVPSAGVRWAALIDSANGLTQKQWNHLVRITRSADRVILAQHRSGRWPTLYECRTSVELLWELFDELAEPVNDSVRYWNERLFHKYEGNLRMVFREWYELWAEEHPIARGLKKKRLATLQ